MIASEEQIAVRGVVRDFLLDHCDEAAVRRAMEGSTGYDGAVWRRACEQIGLSGLTVPEAFGGTGLGLAEAAVVMEEAGRALWGAPVLGSVLAAQALSTAQDDAVRERLLPALAAGELTVAFAHLPDHRGDPPTLAGNAIDGTVSFVADGAGADLFVLALSEDLVVVEATEDCVEVTALESVDLTRQLSRVTFRAAPAHRCGQAAESQAVLDVAAMLIACEQLGGAARCLELAVDYAKVREQFGSPIGSFQAVKHRCVDMYVLVESARAATAHALAAMGTPAFGMAAAVAKATASDAFDQVTADAIQVHGGIGFTWEHVCHLYYRRAVATGRLYGSASEHRERVACELGM